MTSARAVAAVRRIADAAKAGHAGTLDPMATGVLPVALGEATKTVSFLQDGTKAYAFTVRWGESRDTGDADGVPLASSPVRPTAAAIRAACAGFVGDTWQVPPAYSALKVGGRRAYDLARAGAAPVMAARPVHIDRLELADLPDRDTAAFVVECGRGTYVRAICDDLAAALGTLGHVTALRRTRVGRMTETQAISLERLADLVHSGPAEAYLHPVETALADIPALPLTGSEAERLRSGQAIRVADAGRGAVCATAGGHPIAVALVADGELRPLRVFNF